MTILNGECKYLWFLQPRLLKCAAFPVSNFEFQSRSFVDSEFFHSNFSIPLFYVALNVGLYYQKRYQRCFVKTLFLRIPINSQEDTCVRVSFLTSCRPATLLKKRLWHMCFPVNLLKFLRTPFCKEHLRWLLLYYLRQIHIIIIFWWFSYKQVHRPKQTSKMELLAKIVNDLQLLLTILITPSQMFDGLLNTPPKDCYWSLLINFRSSYRRCFVKKRCS